MDFVSGYFEGEKSCFTGLDCEVVIFEGFDVWAEGSEDFDAEGLDDMDGIFCSDLGGDFEPK